MSHVTIGLQTIHAVWPGAGGSTRQVAVFDASLYAATTPSGAPLSKLRVLRGFERLMAVDRKRLDGNHATLRRLNDESGVTVFNAHDKRILDDLIES